MANAVPDSTQIRVASGELLVGPRRGDLAVKGKDYVVRVSDALQHETLHDNLLSVSRICASSPGVRVVFTAAAHKWWTRRARWCWRLTSLGVSTRCRAVRSRFSKRRHRRHQRHRRWRAMLVYVWRTRTSCGTTGSDTCLCLVCNDCGTRVRWMV